MAARRALVRCDDAAVADAVQRRLADDGFQVTVAAPADPVGAVRDLQSLDVLVCAVARPAPSPFVGADPSRWYADVLACLTPAFRLVREAVPALRRSRAGRVVLLGAGWSAVDRPEATAAGAVDGALVALVKTLARDLGPDGVTVNEVVSDPADPPAPEVVAATVAYLSGPAAGAVVGQLLTLGARGSLRP